MPPWEGVLGEKGRGLHRRGRGQVLWKWYLERPWRRRDRWEGEAGPGKHRGAGSDGGGKAGSVALECLGAASH